MLQESTIFFLVSFHLFGWTPARSLIVLLQLLSILAIGFAQGLYALDAADGQSEHTMGVSSGIVRILFVASADLLHR
jgi:hypothetical protein